MKNVNRWKINMLLKNVAIGNVLGFSEEIVLGTEAK